MGNINIRWQWITNVGGQEPAITWREHVSRDGSTVSYVEVATMRRYLTGKDDFLFFEDFKA